MPRVGKTKELLFGRTDKKPIVGECAFPSKDELSAPFEWGEAVIRCFCKGCCTLSEINKNLAEQLAGGGIASFKNKVFVVKRCKNCFDEYTEPILKDI